MKEKTFEVGQVVWLKSGGPPLTIHTINVDMAVPYTIHYCQWFNTNGIVYLD